MRINKLEHDGHADLQGIMPGAPRAVFLPHAEMRGATRRARRSARPLWNASTASQEGSTEIVPTIESAKGLVALGALLQSSPRIRCCMLAVEDLAANLGARRTPRRSRNCYMRAAAF